jgi:MFS family permease
LYCAAVRLLRVGALMDTNNQSEASQSYRFLVLYTLAVSGGAIAYVPFLTILLPLRATELDAGSAMNTLAYAAFLGAIASSLANIGFGWLSDVSKTRKPWIFWGLLFSSAFLALMPYVHGRFALIATIFCWQIFLNMMLAPLSAWAGDCVPHHQKGLLGGFIAFGPAIGAISGIVVTWQGGAEGSQRYWIIAALVIALVTPVLVFGRPVKIPRLMSNEEAVKSQSSLEAQTRGIVVRMWLARLCVQIAEASLFAFLLLWFRDLDPKFLENQAAGIFAATLTVAIAATLIIGRWSDRHQKPILPLALCAFGAACGLFAMANAQSLQWAIIGYVVFGFMGGIFLSLHTSQTLRILPNALFRGRDLGIFNLTNTIPSLVMPWLILALVPIYGFGALFIVLGCLALVAFGLLLTMLRVDRV